MDLKGFEPLTSSMPWKRAPNCATGPPACSPKCYHGPAQPARAAGSDSRTETSGSPRRNKPTRRARENSRPAWRQPRNDRSSSDIPRPLARATDVLPAEPVLPNRAGLLLAPHAATANRVFDRRSSLLPWIWGLAATCAPAIQALAGVPSDPAIAFEQPDRPAGCPRVSS